MSSWLKVVRLSSPLVNLKTTFEVLDFDRVTQVSDSIAHVQEKKDCHRL
jgi:hypothetical protein